MADEVLARARTIPAEIVPGTCPLHITIKGVLAFPIGQATLLVYDKHGPPFGTSTMGIGGTESYSYLSFRRTLKARVIGRNVYRGAREGWIGREVAEYPYARGVPPVSAVHEHMRLRFRGPGN